MTDDERERGWTRYPSAVRPDDPIRPEDIASIPAVYRRTIARWMAEHAARVAGPRAAAWVGEVHQTGYLSAATMFAAQLVDPRPVDPSVPRQADTLRNLVSPAELDAIMLRRDFPARRPHDPAGYRLYPAPVVQPRDPGDVAGDPARVPGPLDAPSVVEHPAHRVVVDATTSSDPATPHPVVVDATTVDDAAAGRKGLLCGECGRPIGAFPCGPAHATAARLYAARPDDPAARWLAGDKWTPPEPWRGPE